MILLGLLIGGKIRKLHSTDATRLPLIRATCPRYEMEAASLS